MIPGQFPGPGTMGSRYTRHAVALVMVIDSGNAEGRKTGVLKVGKDMLVLPTNNAQIPV